MADHEPITAVDILTPWRNEWRGKRDRALESEQVAHADYLRADAMANALTVAIDFLAPS